MISKIFIADVARSLPDKLALVYRNEKIAYRELYLHVLELSNDIQKNFKPGDILAIWLTNSPELIYLYLACFKAGVIPMPFHAKMKWHEVSNTLQSNQIRCLITTKKLVNSSAADISNTSLDLHYLKHNEIDGYNISCSKSPRTGDDGNPYILPEATSLVLQTSGTDGKPKGVMISWESISHILEYRLDYTCLGSTSISVMASCMTQSMGLYQTLAMLAAGGTVVILGDYDCTEIVRCINQWQPTHLIMVVAAWDRLLSHPGTSKTGFANLVFAAAGADKVSRSLQQRFHKLTGYPLNVTYGLTESSWALVNLDKCMNNSHALGKPCPDVEIRLLDKSGCQVAAGEIGEIYIKSPRNMLGYLHNKGPVQKVTEGEWLASGDLAFRDTNGNYWFAGRIKHLIVLSTGDNISPVEIEEMLLSHSDVRHCKVVSAFDHAGSEIPIAYVQCGNSPVTGELLISFLKKRLTDYKIPRKFVFLETMPTGLTGKFQI